MKKIVSYSLFFLLMLLGLSAPQWAVAQSPAPWPMAGYNNARTSWASDGVPGLLRADWVKPIDAYIPQRVQVIAAENKLFLSTAKGLYAFYESDPDGAGPKQVSDVVWMYPTSMPLAHSPTYVVEGSTGFLYVAGFDRKIHKINATTGQGMWTFTADGGFAVNPLVVNGVVYAGSRDGFMYAVNSNGTLNWKFDTGAGDVLSRAPISQSAAYAADTNTIYFGAQNMFAYALNASTGAQVWKSAKLPGLAMNSWWPVVNGTSVYFTVATNFQGKLMATERDDMYAGQPITTPDGTPYDTVTYPAGDHMSMETDKMLNYYGPDTTDPYDGHAARRSLIILNRNNGVEKTPYAPAFWGGMTGSFTKFPPIVDSNGRLYFRNHTHFSGSIPGGHITGWDEGSPLLRIVSNLQNGGFGTLPIDEPGALAGGGSIIYHSHCCSRMIFSVDTGNNDVTKRNTVQLENGLLFPTVSASGDNDRQWLALNWKITGWDTTYDDFFLSPILSPNGGGQTPSFSHSDNNPPIPYNNKVYVHRGNALIAMSPSGTGQLKSVSTSATPPPKATRSVSQIQTLLQNEIQKILDINGPLRPGRFTVGHGDAEFEEIEPDLLELFHNPAETYIVLLRALPHLPAGMQTSLRAYIQARWTQHPATNTKHIGLNTGTPREYHVDMEFRNPPAPLNAQTCSLSSQGCLNYLNYYAAWKYVQAGLGNAQSILSALPAIQTPGTFSPFLPHKLNEAITGYYGYCELYKLVNPTLPCDKQATLDSLISQRATDTWTTIPPEASNPFIGTPGDFHYYIMPIFIHFMHVQPEFAQALNAQGHAAPAIAEFQNRFPLWFMARGTEMQGEGSMQPPQYYHGLFQAKARILKQSFAELEPYLDSPAFAVGDLYYIDNLVAALEADTSGGPSPSPVNCTPLGDTDCNGQVNMKDAAYLISKWGTTDVIANIDGVGNVDANDLRLLITNLF